MAPSKLVAAVLCLSGLALGVPTSSNNFDKRASVNDVRVYSH